MHTHHSTPQLHALAKPILAVLILLVILAPLFRAGNTSLALQWLAIALLTLSFWSPKEIRLSGLEIALLLLLLLTLLLYLLPLPAVLVDSLPGRELYVGAESRLSTETAPAWKPISLNPQATLTLAASLLVPVAVFIAVRRLDAHAMQRVVQILIALAAVQAVLGLVQYGAGQSGIRILFVGDGSYGSATGTYANPNHLAGLLAMALPIAPDRFSQAGAGVGLLALMLHELVDYNLAIPANQVSFALLAGLFLMPPDQVKAVDERRRVRRTPRLETEPVPVMQGLRLPPDQIDNPFG